MVNGERRTAWRTPLLRRGRLRSARYFAILATTSDQPLAGLYVSILCIPLLRVFARGFYASPLLRDLRDFAWTSLCTSSSPRSLRLRVRQSLRLLFSSTAAPLRENHFTSLREQQLLHRLLYIAPSFVANGLWQAGVTPFQRILLFWNTSISMEEFYHLTKEIYG